VTRSPVAYNWPITLRARRSGSSVVVSKWTVWSLALFCPVAERSRNVPGHDVVRQDTDAYDDLEPAQRAGFDEYFVVRTPATARRYRDHVVPGTTLVDEAALGRIFAGWTVDVGSTDPYSSEERRPVYAIR